MENEEVTWSVDIYDFNPNNGGDPWILHKVRGDLLSGLPSADVAFVEAHFYIQEEVKGNSEYPVGSPVYMIARSSDGLRNTTACTVVEK